MSASLRLVAPLVLGLALTALMPATVRAQEPPAEPAATPPTENPAAEGASASFDERCRREVEDLHHFFEDWFNGKVENTDGAYARFADVLAEGFVIVSPNGQLQDRQAVIDGLRSAYAPEGTEPVRIWVEGFELRRRIPTEAGDVAVVTYEEWIQRGENRRGRVSTAILRQREGTPNGIEWLHVHETWLPPDSLQQENGGGGDGPAG